MAVRNCGKAILFVASFDGPAFAIPSTAASSGVDGRSRRHRFASAIPELILESQRYWCCRLQRHREEIIRLYEAGIRWADEQVGTLVNAIRRFGMWDQCVLALTADHGEEFLEHGGRFHAPSKITEELIRVPLLIRVPGGIATRTHKAINKSVFSLMHLAPTLLDTVGIAIPSRFVGRSQCPLDQDR